MNPAGQSTERTYGRPGPVAAIISTTIFGGLFFTTSIFGIWIWRFEPANMPVATLFLSLAILMYPILGYLMYSPRTVASHITAETRDAMPALVFRQSRTIFNSVAIQIAFVTAMFAALFLPTNTPDEPTNGLILILVITCGWQVGYFLLILTRRIKPGHIIIRHDGIHIADHATDTWIPWHTVCEPELTRNPLYILIAVHPNTGARCTSRVPAPWRPLDDRVQLDLHASPQRPPGRYARVDYRRFRIAPELLEAALNHYLGHPELRDELRNPDAVAHIVTQLRAHAPGPLWRSDKTPVQLPILHSAGTPEGENR